MRLISRKKQNMERNGLLLESAEKLVNREVSARLQNIWFLEFRSAECNGADSMSAVC